MITLTVPDDVLAKLRETFLVIEGDCEAWTDEEIVRRTLIRGAMDYAKAANRPWEEVAALAKELRRGLQAAG
ncbi:MAG TPA: hypothetical protein VIK95_10735 [Egibacteraceae bacterium]